MPEYLFANANGELVTEEFTGRNNLTSAQVIESLRNAFALFPYPVEISQPDDMDDVFFVHPAEQAHLNDIYICAKGITPGGRSGLTDEQRIQTKAKYLNYVFQKKAAGSKGVFLGIYTRDHETVFCAWPVASSTAGPETPISKQIKISSIADAMREGFVQQGKSNGGYACAFKPSFLYFYLRNSDWIHGDAVNTIVNHITPIEEPPEPNVARNVLLYGVPGCGKSHEIKEKYCDDKDRMERVVFHPDYTYSDFVGQIMPANVDGHISYPFFPGPFTRILSKAVNNPETTFYLIIEEINRGNAPAIFGDIFQLLDREKGESVYGISNIDIAREVYGDETQLVKIPSNLYLLATMNTADQNVFTLDTAFKRRWRMRSIPNDFSQCDRSNIVICKTGITWESFALTINDMIIDLSDVSLSGEDKRLGAYFISPDELVDSQAFAEKVLMYLWNDAFKYCHDKVFKPEYKTLEMLLQGFEQLLFGIFVDTIEFPMVKASTAHLSDAGAFVTDGTAESYDALTENDSTNAERTGEQQ